MEKKLPVKVLDDTLRKVQEAILAVDFGEVTIKIDHGIPQQVEFYDKKRVKI